MRAASLCPSVPRFNLVPFLLIHNFYPIPSTIAQPSTQPSPIFQPFLAPDYTSILTVGTPYLITWTPTHHFSNVTLEIWDSTNWGYARDFGSFPCYYWSNPFCGTIASHAPNNGTYLWHIPNPVRDVGHRYPTGEKCFWIKMYVDDFWKEGLNTEPVVTYSEKFAFVMQPGADEELGTSSTTALESTVHPTVAPNILQQTTTPGTGYDPTATYSETTTRSSNDTALPTGMLKKNGTTAMPLIGMASKMSWSLLAFLSCLLGRFLLGI